jgi:hypothetical protein
VQVGFSVYNEGLEELTNVEVKVTDKDGTTVCELKPNIDGGDGKGISICGGQSQDILFGYAVGENDTDVEFTITVDYDGAVTPLVQTIGATGRSVLSVNSFKAEITERDPAAGKVNVHVSGLATNSGEVNAAGAQLVVACGEKTLGTISLNSIKPSTSSAFEADYTVDYNEHFTLRHYYNGRGELTVGPTYTEGGLTFFSSREDMAVFTASIGNYAAESRICFSAESDHFKIMSEAESIQLIPTSLSVGNGASDLGYTLTAKTGTDLESAIAATAIDPDTKRPFSTFTLAAAGLDYRLISSDETVLMVSENGRYLIPVKEGKAQVYMVLFPASSRASGGYFDNGGNAGDLGFNALKATRVIDNYLTIPQSQLMVSYQVEVSVGTVKISFYGEDKLSLLGTALKNPDGTVSFAEPVGSDNRSFAGWVDENGNAVELFSLREDANVYAAYKNSYTVTFYDEDGTTVLIRASAEIGTDGIGSLIYPGSIPIKSADNKGSYVFDKWVTSPGGNIEARLDSITAGGISFYASYKLLPKARSGNYTVYFFSENGDELLGSSIASNNAVVYTGGTPFKAGYVFSKWVTEPGGNTQANLSDITEDTSVFASFTILAPYEPVTPVEAAEQIITDTGIVGSGTTVINSDGTKIITGNNSRRNTVTITETTSDGPDGSEIRTKTETVRDEGSGTSVTKTTVTTVSGDISNVVSNLTLDIAGTSATATFAASAIGEIIDAACKTSMTVITDAGKLSFNDSAVRRIAEEAGADAYITVTAALMGTGDLTDKQKTFVEDLNQAIIVDLSLYVSKKDSLSGKLLKQSYFSDFGEAAKIEVELPYVLSAGEDPFNLVVYFISDNGSIEKHAAAYDAVKKTVTFHTTHFSSYIIAYQPGVNFTDVRESDWYYKEVGYAAAMGIIKGRGSAYFGAMEPTTVNSL